MAFTQWLLLLMSFALLGGGTCIEEVEMKMEEEAGVIPEAKHREKRSDDLGALEKVMENLANKVNSLSAQLTAESNSFTYQILNMKDTYDAQLEKQRKEIYERLTSQLDAVHTQLNERALASDAQLGNLTEEVAELKNKTDALAQTVAFYAWNNWEPMRIMAGGILIFDHALTNVGNAYSTLTGIFTAPVTGLYHFQTTFLSAEVGSGNYAKADIYVDNSVVAMGVSDTQADTYDQTTISSVVRVSAGQRVYVKNADHKTNNYHGSSNSPHTTFSGFLLRVE